MSIDQIQEEMGSLGRDQLATRHDLQLLSAELRTEMAVLRSDLTLAIATQTRQLGIWMLGSLMTMGGLAIGVARL